MQKTILITGATSGIGYETANLLYKKGYSLFLVGRDENKLLSISAITGGAPYYVLDLEKTEQIEEMFNYCRENGIRLDGLVHAAGYVINVPVRKYKIEHMEKQIRINYYAFVELCKCFYQRKVSNEGASIVAVSSLATATKEKGSILYSSSKSAMNAAVSIISKEFVKRFIRVNGIMPAYVDTRMTEGLDELINVEEKQPMGMIPPDNIAEVIEFLLSEKSRYITGALLPISAGMEF